MSAQAVESVLAQTYKNIQCFVVVDGENRELQSNRILHNYLPHIDRMVLPKPTGFDNYNGHRIYGAATFLVEGDYLCFLDEDNWYDPNHIESLVDAVQDKIWAYSLRKIVNQQGEYICNDDCESLGYWKSVINDNFVDVGCYMIPKLVALQFAPAWYRRARHPKEQPEVDRLLAHFLFNNHNSAGWTGQYTLNYRVASRSDSVQAEFFLKGNEIMQKVYKGTYPWRKQKAA